MSTIRRDFLYGLLVVVPLASILWLVEFSITIITGPLSQVLGMELNSISGVVVSLILLWLIGFSLRQVVNRSVFPKIEDYVLKVPFISVVYRSIRQVAAVFVSKKQRFLATVFVEYPSKGLWSLGFITNDNVQCMVNTSGDKILTNPIAVFIPSTPNPTNGMFIFVEAEDVQYTSMSVEEGVKSLMSAGMISPDLRGIS